MEVYALDASEIAIRLVTAAALGSLVGWERERKEGAAGLRTHMLVSVGSCLIMIVSAFGFEDILGREAIVLDPSRIAAQVISGIGFLGAGTILFLRPQIVRGLTTAAGLWSVAAVGLAVGGGLYIAAVMATGIILIILAVIKPIEQSMFRSTRKKTLTLMLKTGMPKLSMIEGIIAKQEIVPVEILIHTTKDDKLDQVRITFDHKAERSKILAAVDELKNMEGVKEIISKI